jgi:hypothetical protein
MRIGSSKVQIRRKKEMVAAGPSMNKQREYTKAGVREQVLQTQAAAKQE